MEKRYYKQFDSVRFLAMLFIVSYHYLTHRWPGGFLAVNIFFILSGFFVTRKLEESYESEGSMQLGSTFLRRLKKLFLPMLVVVALSLSYLLLFRFDLLTNALGQVLSSFFFVNNWYQINSGGSYFDEFLHPSVFTHLWYLSVYAQLILFWPLLYRLARPFLERRRHRALGTLVLTLVSALLLALLFQPGTDPTRVYYGTDTRFMSFGWGALLAIVEPSETFHAQMERLWPGLRGLVALVLCGVLGLLMATLPANAIFTYYGGMLLFDVVGVLAVAFLLEEHWLSRLLAFKPLVALGQCTFLAYLWYYPIYIVFYMGAKTQNIFTQTFPLQLLLLYILAILTRFGLQKAKNLPIFQPARDEDGKINWQAEGQRAIAKTTPLLTRILFWVFTMSLLLGGVALAVAPKAARQTDATKAAQEQAKVNESKNQTALQANQKGKTGNEKKVMKEFLDYQKKFDKNKKALYEHISPAEGALAYQEPITFIGDSLTLGMSPAIRTIFPKAYIDAAVGRHTNDVQVVAQGLAEAKQLAPTVVINMGANGGFTLAQVKTLLETLGKDRQIYLVNTHVNRPWRDDVNRVLKQAAEEAGEHVHLIDWAGYYQNNVQNDWLTPDQVHLEFPGYRAWLTLLVQNVSQSHQAQLANFEEAYAELKKETKEASANEAQVEEETSPGEESTELEGVGDETHVEPTEGEGPQTQGLETNEP